MSDDIWTALIGQISPVLTIVALLGVTWWLRKQVKDLAARATRLGIAGIVEISAEPLRNAPAGAPLTEGDVRIVDLRVQRNRERIARMRLLWVDDLPRNNQVERRYLRDVGVEITIATSTEQALSQLERAEPTVVVTDIDRPESTTAGLELGQRLAREWPQLPVIGYVSKIRPQTPPGFFGITDRPDELVHLLLDVAERQG
ncbi:response regulator [Cellulomonas olei]|uniref:response regulator n=1 Tax=Cellulomonas sp. P4 TaxID=3142533 RepID=UPI0031BB2D82